jgi:hypothetical protein
MQINKPLHEAVIGLWFPVGLMVAIGLKLLLVGDLTVLIEYAPHDDGLYVVRAYHLLTSGDFGPYDARTLVKLPAMSFWLAGNRLVGIPYLWSINLLYAAAGLYFIAAARAAGAGKLLAFAAFVLYLFNPISMSDEWTRVMREPLSTILLVTMLASALFIVLRLKERRNPFAFLLVFALAFAFSLLLREEDALLYSVLAMLGAAAWRTTRDTGGTRRKLTMIALVIIVPLLIAGAANFAARQFIEHHYGLPVLDDFTEGEFPGFLAAIRSIESRKDNRMVMVTQERLAKLLTEVPRLAPLIQRLPPPGPTTFSCQLYGVCTEWVNGWMPYFVKDAAAEAGFTPDLAAAQQFFRSARIDIERACAERRLKCRVNGSGLVPPFELRWTRAYLQELLTLLAMTAAPKPHFSEQPARFDGDAAFSRIFQYVTLTSQSDVQNQAASKSLQTQSDNLRATCRRALGSIYQAIIPWFVFLVLIAFVVRVSRWHEMPPNLLALVISLFMAYALVRIVLLAYPSVFFGHFDNRLVFSTHSMLLLAGLFLLKDAVDILRANDKPRDINAQGNIA